jgi:DNA-binding transcriptional ArsR family regulator
MTALLGLLADPVRARLLYALDVAEELCVGDLALALGVNEDQAGYGLRVLRGAGLVSRRKEGRVAYYRLAEGFPGPLREHCLRRLVDLSRADHRRGAVGQRRLASVARLAPRPQSGHDQAHEPSYRRSRVQVVGRGQRADREAGEFGGRHVIA